MSAVAEYVRFWGAGVTGSAGEKGEGGTARREDRYGTADVLIFAGILTRKRRREEDRLQRYVLLRER